MKRIVRKLPNEEYHASDAISHSGIIKLLQSPEHYHQYRTAARVSTPALEFGHAFHTLVLEPAIFQQEFAIVDEQRLAGTLATLDDYKAAATQLGVRFDSLSKDELKVAIKAKQAKNVWTEKTELVRFKDDVQAEIAELTAKKLAGALTSLDEMKQAAAALGIEVGKMKKDELKAAIKAADCDYLYAFRDDVQAEMTEQSVSMLAGTLATLDDYKAAATQLGVKFDALNKDELKAAIKVADKDSKFKFREDEFDRLYGGKIVIKPEQGAMLSEMKAGISRHKGAVSLLSGGEVETSLFWTDKKTGLQCRIRPDYWKSGAIADLKSCCGSTSKEAFGKVIANRGYDIQAAFYVDGMKETTGKLVKFYFIAVEKSAPYAVACYVASEAMLEVGRAKYRAALELLKWCQDKNSYPGYQPGGEIEEIDLPRWAANIEMED